MYSYVWPRIYKDFDTTTLQTGPNVITLVSVLHSSNPTLTALSTSAHRSTSESPSRSR